MEFKKEDNITRKLYFHECTCADEAKALIQEEKERL